MAEASIPVDLFNPGQVFACLGLLEAAEILLGGTRGGFDWSETSNVRFTLHADGGGDPVQAVLDFLHKAEVCSVSPSPTELATEGWGVRTAQISLEEDSFPFPQPSSPASLPARLS